jgi:hypothetical protein
MMMVTKPKKGKGWFTDDKKNKPNFFQVDNDFQTEIRTLMLRLGPENSHWRYGLNWNLEDYFFSKISEWGGERQGGQQQQEGERSLWAPKRAFEREGARARLRRIFLRNDVGPIRPHRLSFSAEVLCLEVKQALDWWPHLWRHNQMSPVSSNERSSFWKRFESNCLHGRRREMPQCAPRTETKLHLQSHRASLKLVCFTEL